MRTKSSWCAGICLLALLCAVPAAAQEQTGSIQGVVKDASGAVLPGATVEARSPRVVGVNTATTDSQGVYRFPALPPATYTITATLSGFTVGKVENVVLALGQSLTVPFTLSVSGVTETVTVTGASPLIDTKQNAAFSTVSQDVISRIPKGRDFTDVIQLAPGANDESKAGGIQVDGASGSENRFVIDGMDTTNLVYGTSGKTMLIDFIQEVQVKSSGYNAEFGGATGGVVSALTKSGSNQFRGSAGLYEQNNRFSGSYDKRPSRGYSPWVDPNTGKSNPETGLISGGAVPWQYYSPVGDIGGPIFKDKAWFYGGIAYQQNRYVYDMKYLGEPGHPLHHFDYGDWAYYPNYNVTTQITNNMRLRVGGSDQRNRSRGGGPGYNSRNQIYDGNVTGKTCNALALSDFTYGQSIGGYSGTSSPSWLTAYPDCKTDPTKFENTYTKTGSDSRNDSFSGNLDWLVNSRFFVNVQTGLFRTNSWGNPDWVGDDITHRFRTGNLDTNMLSKQYPPIGGGTWPLVPTSFQNASGYADQTLSSSITTRNILTRTFLNVNSIWYRSLAGQHVIKAGVRYERDANDILNGATKPTINLYWGRTYQATNGQVYAGKYGYYMINQQGTVGNVASTNWSLWVQDSWAIKSNLTINAGVRTEREFIPSYKTTSNAMSLTFPFSQKIAPRVGFAYDIKGDSKWKAYGSFGIFYDIMKLDLPRSAWGGDHWINYYWTLDTYDWGSINCGEGGTGCPGTFIEQWDARYSSNQPDNNLAKYFNRPGMTGIDPNLKPMRTGEWTLGMDHELNTSTSIGVRYVHKWLTRTIEDVGILIPGVGEIYIDSNPGFGYSVNMLPAYPQFTTPKATRDYDGVELRLRKRLSRRFMAEVDYTYSRLWGNYGGLASSDESGRTDPNVNRYYDNLYMSYDDNQRQVFGLLPTDRPHFLKMQATYDFPWGTTVGAYGIVESGQPQTSQLSYAGYPIYFNDRNDLGRTPVYKQVDLNVQQDIHLGKTRMITLGANITNLFDFAGYTSLYTTFPYRSGVTPTNADATFFNAPWTPAQLVDAANASGANILPSDFYNLLEGHQGRRAIRFNMRFSF